MTRWRWSALLAVAIVVGASVAAACLLPDPWWIKGVYDAADGDDALSLVWEQAPATAPGALALLTVSAASLPAWRAPLSKDRSFPLASSSRAPPLA